MAKRIDLASRLIEAPPSVVYAAFAEPEALAQWLSPQNMVATMLHFDFHEGGSYRMRLTYQELEAGQGKTSDNADVVDVRLLKLVEGKRIEQAITFESDDPAFSGVMRMTWTFEPAEKGTLVTIRAEDVPWGIRPEDHEIGVNSTLDKLALFLGS